MNKFTGPRTLTPCFASRVHHTSLAGLVLVLVACSGPNAPDGDARPRADSLDRSPTPVDLRDSCSDRGNIRAAGRWTTFEIASGTEVGNIDAAASDDLAVISWELDGEIFVKRIALTPNQGTYAGSPGWVWQPTESLSPASTVFGGPVVDVADSKAALIWISSADSAAYAVFVSQFDDTWMTGAPVDTLAPNTSFSFGWPSVATNAVGDVFAGWAANQSNQILQYVRLRPAAGQWGTIRSPTNRVDGSGEAPLTLLSRADVALLDGVGTVTVSVGSFPSPNMIQFSTLAADGSFNRRNTVASDGSYSRPLLAVPRGGALACAGNTPTSTAALIFNSQDGSSILRDTVSRLDITVTTTGFSLGPTRIAYTSTPTAGETASREGLIDRASVAADVSPNGTVISSWVATDKQTNERILTTKFEMCGNVVPDRQSWDYEMTADYPTIQAAGTDAKRLDERMPEVAMGSNGQAGMAWPQRRDGKSIIQYRRFYHQDANQQCGERWVSTGGFEDSRDGDALDPEVIVLDETTMLVFWREVSVTEERVMGGIFATGRFGLLPPSPQ